jgi:hypothetical protein
VLSLERCDVRIRTFAEGLFSKLAHDLELTCHDVTATVDGDTATFVVKVDRIAVAGAVKNGRVDPNVLSASYCEEILAKMKREVFHGAKTVEITADRSKVVVKMNGKAVEKRLTTDGNEANGILELSLQALGSDPVKGPMNAFRVRDRVEVHYDVAFKPA